MGNEPLVNVKYALICDDIRREDNGKLILIGAYPDCIAVSRFPLDMRASIAIFVETMRVGRTDVTTGIFFNEKNISTMSGVLEVDNVGKASLITPSLRIRDIDGPGTLHVRIKEGDGEWQEAVSIPIANMDEFFSIETDSPTPREVPETNRPSEDHE